MHDDDHPLLIAYVSGDLPPDAARAFEARVEADPALQAELAGLRAVRALLDRDAQWGERSGADAPPPHLVDAILRAEVLARPPELRAAIGKRGDARPFLAKVTTWLVGGGVLAGAAAAVLLVAKADRSEPPSAAATAKMVTESPSPIAAPAPAMAPPPPAPTMDTKAGAARDPMAYDLRLESAKAEAPMAEARDGEAFAAGGKDQDRAKLAKQDARGELESSSSSSLGLGRAAGAATGATSTMPAPDPPPPPKTAAAPAPAKEAWADADDAPAEKKAPPQRKPSAQPAPDAIAQAEEDAPTSRGNAVPADAPGGYAADKAEPSPSSSTPPAVTTPSPAKAKGKAPAAPAQPSSGPPPLSPEMKRLADETRASRQADAKKSAEKPEAAKQRTDAERSRRTQDAQMALATGARELGLGRAMEAVDAFIEADVLDRGIGALGVDPVVGQMRAYEKLKRYDDVLGLVPRLGADPKKPGVADGLLVAARAAEAKGDARRATDLYNKVATVAAKRQEAQKALRRMAVDDEAAAAAKAAEPAAAAK